MFFYTFSSRRLFSELHSIRRNIISRTTARVRVAHVKTCITRKSDADKIRQGQSIRLHCWHAVQMHFSLLRREKWKHLRHLKMDSIKSNFCHINNGCFLLHFPGHFIFLASRFSFNFFRHWNNHVSSINKSETFFVGNLSFWQSTISTSNHLLFNFLCDCSWLHQSKTSDQGTSKISESKLEEIKNHFCLELFVVISYIHCQQLFIALSLEKQSEINSLRGRPKHSAKPLFFFWIFYQRIISR